MNVLYYLGHLRSCASCACGASHGGGTCFQIGSERLDPDGFGDAWALGVSWLACAGLVVALLTVAFIVHLPGLAVGPAWHCILHGALIAAPVLLSLKKMAENRIQWGSRADPFAERYGGRLRGGGGEYLPKHSFLLGSDRFRTGSDRCR